MRLLPLPGRMRGRGNWLESTGRSVDTPGKRQAPPVRRSSFWPVFLEFPHGSAFTVLSGAKERGEWNAGSTLLSAYKNDALRKQLNACNVQNVGLSV